MANPFEKHRSLFQKCKGSVMVRYLINHDANVTFANQCSDGYQGKRIRTHYVLLSLCQMMEY